jgi:hypothetical protein
MSMSTASPGTQAATPASLPRPLRFFAGIEKTLAWAFAYPLLPAQMLLLILIAWGGLGASLGLDALFWEDARLTQFFIGLGSGLLFGEILLVRYLLDRQRDRFRYRLSLFPCDEPKIRRLGEFLFLFWPASLLVLSAPKLVTTDLRQQVLPLWPLFCGLALSVGLASVLVTVGERLGVRAALQRSRLFGVLPGVVFSYIPEEDYPLHALAFVLTLLALAGLGAVYAVFLGGGTSPPMLVLCLVLGLFSGVFGFVAFQLRGLQHVLVLALIGWAVLANQGHYKFSFPGLEDYYPAARGHTDDRVRLDEEKPGVDHYYRLLSRRDHSAEAAGLIDSEEPLAALSKRWQGKHGDASKPRLVLVATSGGGIRAAVWTAVVLEGLECDVPGLREHIRLFTGASGGMVAAAHYAADFEGTPAGEGPFDETTGLGRFSGMMARDGLSPTVQTMLLADLPALWWSRPVNWDRGRALEKAWHDNTRSPDGSVPLQKTFAELRQLEQEGRRPSLVFSPMLVEDSRRLLISNLDLEDLTQARGSHLEWQASQDLPPVLSLSAVEFRRLFPEARSFQVGTAARMSATFPVVGPTVSLPTDPPRRVVDAGYYDDYGVDLAALWLYHHRKAVCEHTSGVVLINVRAYRLADGLRHIDPASDADNRPPRRPAPADLVTNSLEWLSTPMEALLTARDRVACYRNDDLLQVLEDVFNGKDRQFFTTVSFECSRDAALSWRLPANEATEIVKGYYTGADRKERQPWIDKRVRRLQKWFGEGGR